jgi:hypothetical protein
MRNLFLLLFLVVPSFAGDQPCLIAKQAGIWVIGPNWQYVEGDFPAGMKWKSNLTDRNIQKGGRVVIVPEKYSSIDLEDARKQCGVRQPAPK